jgi:hypothetical protein
MQGFFLGGIPDHHWRPLFDHYLAEADSWLVHVPDGDGELSDGREEFLALPGVTVRPWEGMRGAVEIAGAMSAASRELFGRLKESLTSYEEGRHLWDFRLLRAGHVVLSVSDFSDLLIWPTPDDRAALTAAGIPDDDWDAVRD